MPRLPCLGDDRVGPPDLVDAIRRRRGGRLMELDRLLLYSPPLAAGWNEMMGRVRTQLTVPGRLRAVVGTAGLVLIAGCPAPVVRQDPLTTEPGVRAAGGRLLAGPEAQATLGKPQRYRWTTTSGASGFTQVAAGGRIRSYWDNDAVNGRIRFTETGYCTRYEGVRDNREDCYRLYRMTATAYRIFRDDGSFSGSITLER